MCPWKIVSRSPTGSTFEGGMPWPFWTTGTAHRWVCGVVLLIFGALFLLTLTAYYSTTVPSALDAAITRIWVLFHLRSLKSPKFSCLGFQNFHNFFQKTNFNSFVIQVSLTKSSPLKLRPCGAIQICLLLLLLFFDHGTQFQGMKKITLCNTKKYKNHAGMNLTLPPL